ncbi:sarcosine dehydrogenase [Kiloniella spongiae]|uniref:Sarcosine dehydrogenase n=1 Tax=Kiloniella spongiae TaxID=1489064 RepID=A0A0H2ME24_9PROT|nr:FAD-dependent oxidoreductase [Kiloniella spongiae]KLN60623.1 sarcosine dehydrogenase [Kiloniella spongiae]
MSDRRHVEVLVIGGGIIGCSIAYHLTRMGKQDVAVLEKNQLTHGATWHAAGLVGQLRSSRNTTRMLQKSVELYDKLEAETGQSLDWKKVGSLRLASSKDRMLEIKRLATTSKSFGLEMQILTAQEAQELFPIMTTDGVEGAAYIPSDGYIDPSSVCQALAKGARDKGAKIHQGVEVLEVRRNGRQASEVVTSEGTWTFDILVNAGGMWSRELGILSNVKVPACALEHQYMITDPIPDMPKNMPTMRDPDRLIYYKPEVRGMVVGGYERGTLPFGDEGIPQGFGRELLGENFDRFEELACLASEITPVINTVGIRELINGPIPYSADGDFVMGKAVEFDNYFVASGFLYGIAAGGGAGQMMAEWIIDEAPSLDLWPLDIRRFSEHHNTNYFMYNRAVEHYGGHYLLHKPGEEAKAARGIRRSPLYNILKEKGACYGSRAGWERPNWFALNGLEPVDQLDFDRRKTNWFSPVAKECKAVRENVGLIDQSSFAKMEVVGPGALAALQGLAISNLDKLDGAVVYTQLCNEKGGIEADLTICRLGRERFYVITGSGFSTHDFHWIKSHLPVDGSVHAFEVTSAKAVINICGPNSRAVLQAVTRQDISNVAFPFSTCQQIEIGAATLWALRIGYVGELGWELHIPTEFAAHVYEQLWEAGQPYDIANVGYRAIDSLRMEKGYVYWSSEVTPDYTPYAAGLGFKVALKSKGDFIGREALQMIKESGPTEKLSTFTVEADVSLYGAETIFRGDDVVGLTTSANYGHTMGAQIAMGYLPVPLAGQQGFEIEAFGKRYPAVRIDGALYDPMNKRLKM